MTINTDILVSELDEPYDIRHYGIKGMRWGVRRTRAQIDADSADVVTKKSTQAKIAKNRTTDVLSNQELQALNTRLQLEQNYAQLVAREKANAPESPMSKGAKWAGNFAKDVANQQAKNLANAIIKEALTNQAKKKGLLSDKNKKKDEDED